MSPARTGKKTATRMWTKKEKNAQNTKMRPTRIMVNMSWIIQGINISLFSMSDPKIRSSELKVWSAQ